MKIKIFINYIIILGVFLMSNMFCAVNAQSSFDARAFVARQNQAALEQAQKNKEILRKNEEAVKIAQEQAARDKSVSKDVSSKPSTETTKEDTTKKFNLTTPPPFCNCNDTYSKYNYKSNYLYDHQGGKVYQIEPYCKCRSTPTTVIGTIESGTKNQTPQASTNKKPEASGWNIRY